MKLGLLMVAMLFALSVNSLATTLSFDDIPSGSDLTYYSNMYGVTFSQGFQVATSGGAGWGTPHSGTDVLTWNADATHAEQICFGNCTAGQPGAILPYSCSSFSAYFSTAVGIVINVTAYHGGLDHPVACATIGAQDESWDNHYAELDSYLGNIDFIVFEGVGSPDARLGFCMDDVTITPAP